MRRIRRLIWLLPMRSGRQKLHTSSDSDITILCGHMGLGSNAVLKFLLLLSIAVRGYPITNLKNWASTRRMSLLQGGSFWAKTPAMVTVEDRLTSSLMVS